MRTQSYWDLSEFERGLLTADEVKEYETFELMQKGIHRPKEPVLEEVPEVQPKRQQYFRVLLVGANRYSSDVRVPIAFESLEDAESFTRLSIAGAIEDDYSTQLDVVWRPSSFAIEAVNLVDSGEFERVKEAAQNKRNAESRNESARNSYAKALKEAAKETESIWSDWREQQNSIREAAAIRETLDEYKQMCSGDEAVAMRFLLKTFEKKWSREFIAGALGVKEQTLPAQEQEAS